MKPSTFQASYSIPASAIPATPAPQAPAQASASSAPPPRSGSRHSRSQAMSGSTMRQHLMAEHGNTASASGMPPAPAEDRATRKKNLSKSVYDENRYYQGTTTLHAADRRANGMDPQNKVGSSVTNGIALGYVKMSSSRTEKFRNAAMSHFYFTKLKTSRDENMSATDYALLASAPDGTPKVIRAFLPEESGVSLHVDPDSPAESEAFRTSDKVPAGSVLPSKKGPLGITKASEDFKTRFNNNPARTALRIDTINSREAAFMLRQEQTNSDSDFADVAPWR